MRLRQLSNHPKMIDKKSELDSGKYIAVTRYLKQVQSNQKTIVFSSFVSNLEFYKMEHRKQLIFCELTGATHKMNAYQVQKFQEQERSKLFFISLKQVA
jgi:non-specific serine/threonine protein kinase